MGQWPRNALSVARFVSAGIEAADEPVGARLPFPTSAACVMFKTNPSRHKIHPPLQPPFNCSSPAESALVLLDAMVAIHELAAGTAWALYHWATKVAVDLKGQVSRLANEARPRKT